MPIPVAAAKGAAVAVSIAVAAAIAIYESPELRRYADNVRRRVAITLTSMADGINPPEDRAPLFNRPEDVDGFLRSGRNMGVDADEASQARQREELMYWNAIKIKKEQENPMDDEKTGVKEEAQHDLSEKQNQDAVVVSGVDMGNQAQLRNRFDDGTGNRSKQDDGSDIYSATTATTTTIDQPVQNAPSLPMTTASVPDFEFHTAGQNDRNNDDAFASIAEWAQSSQQSSSVSDAGSAHWVVDEPGQQSDYEHASDGQLTPTSNGSVVDFGGDDAVSRDGDVMSESDDLITPDWSEIGSVVSDGDVAVAAHSR